MTEAAQNSPTETPMPSATAELIQPTALPTLAPAAGAATDDPNAPLPGLPANTLAVAVAIPRPEHHPPPPRPARHPHLACRGNQRQSQACRAEH